ncbi:hypothetical protein [Spiroplasma endosymbiont of 'Nebria riversi']|uniref:hypothetical protein n=1 Tax=Spiroplasma endosymbiont of 'Nebria riversi' TaxID=2792084 RepID=UPI001FE920A3|nr:hypothetical protein [Spiroplasma endosymbiont of 'Nebria riversi']
MIQISLLGQSSKTISVFKKLSGKIQIDETFIKEIHKGNFKHKTDPRRIRLDPFATNTKCCI